MSDYDYGYDMNMDKANRIGGFVIGVFVGALICAGAMLLYAPQSGVKMRKQLRRKAEELRDTASETYEETVDMARERAKKVSEDVRSRVEDTKQRGQEMLEEQKDRVQSVVQAGRDKIKRK